MKKLIVFFFLLISVVIFSQKSSEKLIFNFYPSSGGSAIYVITLEKDSIKINNYGSRNSIRNFERKLTKKELKCLEKLISKAKSRQDIETNVVLDSWRAELLIDGQVYYNESKISIKTLPKDIKKLLKFLAKKSTLEIDLYGFA